MQSQVFGPLPDSQFIATNQPVERPQPLTTCTKAGKKAATTTKRKAQPKKKDVGEATKKTRGARKYGNNEHGTIQFCYFLNVSEKQGGWTIRSVECLSFPYCSIGTSVCGCWYLCMVVGTYVWMLQYWYCNIGKIPMVEALM
jgi:hypothetical protein